MQDLEGVKRSKEKILSTLKLKGPSLPVQISKEINFSPLFASAFLSELKAEGKVRMSSMMVGSSPLYFLPGQEEMLEKFSAYLNQREKEAFFLLKEKKVLEDGLQDPVMRVALRAIKDFASSVRITVDEESKLFWRYFTVDEQTVPKLVREGTGGVKFEEESISPKRFEKVALKKEVVRKEIQHSLKEERPLAVKKKVQIQESEFVINVKDYLRTKDVEILEVYEEKKREFEARIRIDTLLGKQEFYLIAKDKKTVTDNDFVLAWQKAHSKKMLASVMSTGELSKKGKGHLVGWGNLVKFEKLRF